MTGSQTSVEPNSHADLDALFARCSNWGRWGPDDERGTLNYIDAEKVRSALALPRHGVTTGLGRDLQTGDADVDQENQFGAATRRTGPIAISDEWRLTTHGFGITHIDAPAHTLYRDGVYNGRGAESVLSSTGLRFGSIAAYGAGIVTRGVLLDVATARGVDYLETRDAVSIVDLEAAESLGGISVGTGDAIFVRTGLGERRARHGFDGDDVRAGVVPEVLGWLHDREIAIYSGDCIERLPSGNPVMSHPLHQIGQVAMGLCMLDIPDVERLASVCRTYATNAFLLIVAPLRVDGASGSPVNPLAVF